ncbi:recombinase family protein [Lysinibacillus sp. NPDC097287]|uniref:recombinase family protein n=1 Tax=Lysinibacillus sp. NPDC097287 TaxID=3364144 RepID=UPI00382CFDA2
MIYGYKRPLLDDENGENQLKKVRVDQLVWEEHGLSKNRDALEQLLLDWQQGDIVIVERLAVLADSLNHLLDILRVADKDGVTLQFRQEGITNKNLHDMDLAHLVEHFANFQSDNKKQSNALSQTTAKKNTVILGPFKESNDNLKNAIAMYHSGYFTLMQIKEQTGISKSILYRSLDNLEQQ